MKHEETAKECYWISPKQASERLGISVRTLYTWRELPDFPRARKVGQIVKWRADELDAWLNEQVEGPKAGTCEVHSS